MITPAAVTEPRPAMVTTALALSVEPVTDYESFVRMEPVWNRLVDEAGTDHPFLRHEWVRTWWDCFGAGKQLHVLVVKAGGAAIAIAPFMLGRERMYGVPVRVMEFISNVYTERFDFIIASRPEEAYRAIWAYLVDRRAQWDVLRLSQLRADSRTLALLTPLAVSDGYRPGLWHSTSSPYVPLHGTWDEYAGSLDRKHRSNLRNRLKRLGQLGDVALEEASLDAQLEHTLDEGFRLEAAAWKGRAGTAINARPELRRFYTLLAQRAAQNGRLRLYFLTVNRRRIAFHYSLCCGNKLYLLKPGYDPQYAPYSPSNLLCEKVLRNAFERGGVEYDFLGAEATWKLDWAKETRPHCWLFVFSNSPRTRVLHWIKFKLAPRLKQHRLYRTLRDAASTTGDRWKAPQSLTTGPSAVRIVHEHHDLKTLARGWNLLAAKSGRPMQSYAWFHACVPTFLAEGRLHVVVVGEPSHPTAIAPLVRQRNGSVRLEFLGVRELYEPTDILFAEPSALASLARHLVQSGATLFLNRLPVDSPAMEIFKRAYQRKGVVVCRSIAGTPWIPLDDSWRQPEHRLSSRRHSDFRRARRIAESMGTISHDVLTPAPADLEPLLDEAFQVEAAGWKGRSRSALASDGTTGTFFRRCAAAACQEGILRLCFLRIGGRAAAMQLAVECGNRFWLLKIGYDETFARCSPGMLLLVETMRHAAARGLCATNSWAPWSPGCTCGTRA